MNESIEKLADDRKGCTLAGPGRGDCEHFLGWPEVLDESTTDVYGIPKGWCLPCYQSRKIHQLESKVLELTEALRQIEGYQCKHIGSWPTWPDKDPATIAREALSTTPAADIRERIRVEGFNEGVEASRGVFETLVSRSDNLNFGMHINAGLNSIKKEAN